MALDVARSLRIEAQVAISGDLVFSPAEPLPLASLPVGAHLILRCRKDWRAATIVAVAPDRVTLSVGSPSGHTYRVRRTPSDPLSFDGSIPLLGGGQWRAGFARYDPRW